MLLIFIDQLNMGVKEPIHLVSEACSITARAATSIFHAQLSHELGKRRTQNQHTALSPYRFSRNQARIKRGKFP